MTSPVVFACRYRAEMVRSHAAMLRHSKWLWFYCYVWARSEFSDNRAQVRRRAVERLRDKADSNQTETS